jgi:hypothetical protein
LQTELLEFVELEQLDAPLEWWEHASYIIAIIGGAAANATSPGGAGAWCPHPITPIER